MGHSRHPTAHKVFLDAPASPPRVVAHAGKIQGRAEGMRLWRGRPMIFCSPWFLVFSLAAAAAYLAVRRWYLLRLILLPIASVVFYVHCAGVSGFAVMGALSVFTYFAGGHY